MRGAPQAGDTRRDAGEGVGTRRAGEANGRGRRILFVIGVEDEDAVEGALDGRHDFIFLRRNAEGHAQEIARVAEVVARIDEGLAERIRSEEHTSELQSLMRISYSVFCLTKKNK